MNLLLDTHILIWALNDDPRLSKKAKEMILDRNNTVYYSAVSVWEIAIKHANHPENVAFCGNELAAFCEQAGFVPLELGVVHIEALETLIRADGAPPHHDPFDRMLIAQAKAENIAFLTHDAMLPFYQEKCVVTV